MLKSKNVQNCLAQRTDRAEEQRTLFCSLAAPRPFHFQQAISQGLGGGSPGSELSEDSVIPAGSLRSWLRTNGSHLIPRAAAPLGPEWRKHYFLLLL